ncbi:MAG TPA: hypothetical protein VKP78_07300 [bacterium]|nr:hypothetical protein [bacterium]
MSIIRDIPDAFKKFKRTDQEKKVDRQRKTSSEKVKNSSQKTESASGSKTSQTDRVEISSSGKSIMESASRIEDYQESLDQIDNLNKEQLLEVHQRVEDNYYDDPEVINEIVENMTSSLPEAPVDNVESGVEGQERVGEISAERLDEIKKNIEEEKYDSEEVLEEIAERMLNPRLFEDLFSE